MTLSGVVECDEVYIVAGHKGQPDKVAEAGREPRCRRLQGARGRGTAATEKPPVFGMIQRTGEVVIRMLDNVQQATIKPLILQTIMPGTQIYTDEYNIYLCPRGYSRLEAWGYPHLCPVGIRRSTIRRGNMPVTRTATVSAKSIRTPWKASGRCCAHGYAPIGAYHRPSCPCTSAFLSLSIMSENAGRACCLRYWLF